MNMKENIDLSIIIVNHDTPDLANSAMESCLSAASGIDMEIIIVDNSTKNKFDENSFKENNLILILQTENKGFASAVNLGIQKSRGKYCLLLNSDAKIINGALHRMINCLDIHDNAACVGGRIKNENNLTEVSWGYFPNLFVELRLKIYKIMLDKSGFFRKRFEKKMTVQKKVDWISGAFMMIKKKLLHEIGGFDDNYFLYFEDIDLCRRFADKGCYSYYIPEAESIHLRGASVNMIDNKKALKIKRDSQKRYYKKFNSFLSNFFLKWVTFKR